METRTGADPMRACHDVLLAMAGRVPDRTLWRLREWADADPERAGVALRTALPRTLVRHRIGVTESERVLLRRAVIGWDGPVRPVDTVLHLDEAPSASPFTFGVEGPRPGWDAVDLVLRACAPAGASEIGRAWRRGAGPPGGPARVVVVRAVEQDGADLAALTATLQRVLRAHGEADPRVEVVAPDSAVTPYLAAAMAAAEPLWSVVGPGTAAHPSGQYASGELVGHG